MRVTDTAPRILIADAAADIRAAVRFTLQSHGWTVIEAATPAATMEIGRAHV